MPPKTGLGQYEVVNQKHYRDNHRGPGNASVGSHNPSNYHNQNRQRGLFDDKNSHGSSFKIIAFQALPVPDLGINHGKYQADANDHSEQMKVESLAPGQIGNVAVRELQKGPIPDDNRAGTCCNHGKQSPEHKHARQCCHKGRNLNLGHQEALVYPDQDTAQQYKGYYQPHIPPVHEQNGCHCIQETCHKADGQVNMLDNQNQRHANGQYRHITCLVHQVDQVPGRYKQAVGGNCKNKENDCQGNIHCIVTNVFHEQRCNLSNEAFLLVPGTGRSCRFHHTASSTVFVAMAITFSSVASLASSSPVMVPSDIM